MPKKTIFMGSTQISPIKTCGEIIQKLVACGVSEVSQTFGPGGKVIGISFCIMADTGPVPFKMPVNVEAVFQKMRAIQRHVSRDQAERTAWRQVLRWIEAQLAFIDTGSVKAAEAFTPYMILGNGETCFEWIERTKLKALPMHASD